MSTLEIGMMVAFLLALGLSMWKLYAFMPNTPLEDDDTNPQATKTLKKIMYEVIATGEEREEKIVEMMKEHPHFDKEHFWRFNLNRFRQLLNTHYSEYPDHQNIQDIHHHLKKDTKENTNA